MLANAAALFLSLNASAHIDEAPMTPKKNYDDIVSFIHQIHERFPNNTKIFTIGYSDTDNLPIYGIQIGHGSVENLVVATHHGNEYGSTEIALGVISDLAENPISWQTVHVIPVLNTYGYNRRFRREKVGARQIDPNRDYPGPCKTDEAFLLKSTSSLAQFVQKKNIINVATLHTYASAVLYPWGLSTEQVDTRYTSRFKEMGEDAVTYSGYKVANSTLELYPADGTFEDYVFWRHGVWSMLFELGSSHYPTPEQIQQMIEVNVPGIRNMFENAPLSRAQHHAFEGLCHKLRGLIDLKKD